MNIARTQLIRQFFVYDYIDIHRGLLSVIGASIAMLMAKYMHLNLSLSLWLITAAVLSCITLQGPTKRQQTVNLILLAVLGSLFVALMTLVYSLHIFPVSLCGIFILVYAAMCLPRLYSALSGASILMAVYVILDAGLAIHPTIPTWTFVSQQMIAVTTGTVICVVINLMLPRSPSETIPIDQTTYFFKRVFRICSGIVIAFVVSKLLDLKHPSWICLAVLVVSQSNLGASIRRASQRFTGTVMGVILGIPATTWIFAPHPITRWLSLAALFPGMTVIKRHYHIGVFFITFLLAAAYYALVPSGMGGVEFILYRLLDTLIGVVIAIITELIIFPRSMLHCLRKHYWKYWDVLYLFFISTQHQKNDEAAKYCNTLQSELNEIDTLMTDFKYEPLGFLTLQYHQLVIFTNKLQKLAKALANLKSEAFSSDMIQSDNYTLILYTINKLTGFNESYSRAERLRIASNCYQDYVESYNKMEPMDNITERQSVIRHLNKELLFILKDYKLLLSISPWRLYYGKMRMSLSKN